MRTLMQYLKRLGKAVHYGSMIMVFACAILFSGAARADDTVLNCSASIAQNLDFGTINVLRGAPATTSGTLSYSCQNVNNKKDWVMLCFSIGTGSGAGGAEQYNPRKMQLNANNANKLNYQIYQDSARTVSWGSAKSDALSGPIAVGPINVDKRIPFTGQIPMYASVMPSQNTAFAGPYSSNFAGAHTEIAWRIVTEATQATPSMCKGIAASDSFGFNVYATVANHCYISTSDLNFGTVSGIAGGSVAGQTQIDVQCTNGTGYQIGLSSGSNSSGNTRYMKKTSGADRVRYELYTDAGHGNRWGNTQDVDTLRNLTGTGLTAPIAIYGQAFPGTTATVGDYSDTVTITLYY